MLTSSGKYIRLLVACANVLGVVFGTGVHLHLLLAHEHESDRAHRHDVVVHSHAGIPDYPGETTHRQPDGEHRHHVPLIQIVAVNPASMQTESYALQLLESCTLSSTALSPDLNSFCWITFTDTSPPFKQRLTEDISGRSPPLV